MKHLTTIFIVLIISCSGLVGASMIKDGLIRIKTEADRSVSVKGLAERNVKSDLAVWPIRFKATGNNLEQTQTAINNASKAVMTFLQNNGFNDNEIWVDKVTVSDAMANQYNQNNVMTRYAIDKTIMVRTNKVDAVVSAARNAGDLIAKGVVVSFGSEPEYSFTNLNDIKPEMIAQATKNAREAAQQFAFDANAKIGGIKTASQGYFSIQGRDDIGGVSAKQSLFKKVRVVSTVEYYLND